MLTSYDLPFKQVEPSSEGLIGLHGLHIWEPKMTYQNDLTFPLCFFCFSGASVRLFLLAFPGGWGRPFVNFQERWWPSSHTVTIPTIPPLVY